LGHSKVGSSGHDQIYDLAWAPEPVNRYVAVGKTVGPEMNIGSHDSQVFAPCQSDRFTCGGNGDMLVMTFFEYYNRDLSTQDVISGTIKVSKTGRFGGSSLDVAYVSLFLYFSQSFTNSLTHSLTLTHRINYQITDTELQSGPAVLTNTVLW